jgi:hypothetical protein
MVTEEDVYKGILSDSLDLYMVMYHSQNATEQLVANKLQDRYNDIAIDNFLHPDDDFEDILNIIGDELYEEYKHLV